MEQKNNKYYQEIEKSVSLLLISEKKIIKRCRIGLSVLGSFFLMSGFILFFVKDIPLWSSSIFFSQGLLTIIIVNWSKISKCIKNLKIKEIDFNLQSDVILTTLPGGTFLKPKLATINSYEEDNNIDIIEENQVKINGNN